MDLTDTCALPSRARSDLPAPRGRPHSDTVVNAARALLKGAAPDGLFGTEVEMALRGYRAGMVDCGALLDALTAAYRRLGRDATLFDSKGNLRKM